MEQETKIQTSTRMHEMIAPLLADGLCAAVKRRGKNKNSEIHNIRFADNEHMRGGEAIAGLFF